MFVYLSKKIAIPNQVKLRCVSWNSEQGWIACGGDNGLLKVLKLDGTELKPKGGPAPNNLSMNQTLEGHNGSVVVVTWNEDFRKLTSSDENGLIIVWMLHKGMWFEEMINNRNRSVVRDMKWTSDGSKICIVYEDGAVIVGSVDGNRLWGKEVKRKLTNVEWSPDGRFLLFGTLSGEVHIYESKAGNYLNKMNLYCLEDTGPDKLVGIDWYDGKEGYQDPNAPTLAVCFANGRCQLMRSEMDEKPVIIDTGMKALKMSWNTSGSVLTIAGLKPQYLQNGDQKDSCTIQFYNPYGQHLRSLKVPGSGISAISWEGTGLRIAFAVDSFIYFANVRPDYKWGYFAKTVVYAFTKLDRPEHCVIFWNTKTGEKYTKYVKRLMSITAAGENCAFFTKTDDVTGQHIVILCNTIGSPVDSKYIEIEPLHVTMTPYHVVCASEDTVYVWQYRTHISQLASLEYNSGNPLQRAESKERIFHIDDQVTEDSPNKYQKNNNPTNDPISCVCASDKYLLVGRASGVIHQYSLPQVVLECTFELKCRPQIIALNSDSTRISVIDISGVLTFYKLEQLEGKGAKVEQLPCERKDVWDMKWSEDNPELFAMMEKTRMYVFRDLDPEEPVLSSAYICSFNNLKIKAILLDEIMNDPEHPHKDLLLNFETRSLRDTRNILKTVSIKDAYDFVKDNPHPRLWKLLAETSLEKLDFDVADKALVKCLDYQGIQFVKRLRMLDDKMKQKAEVACYFKRFDEAERIYKEIDRKDLAVELRMRLGDWFKVVQLVQEGGGDDELISKAWDHIGEYYADRQMWTKAVQFFSQSKNYARLVECFYILEDYKGLERVIASLPENSPLLVNIGEKFASVGISEHAVQAFLKAGEVKAAIDCCVELNQWDKAVELAEKHKYKEIENLLSKYANYLVDRDKLPQAVELYQKANHHTEAAKLLSKLAQEAGKTKMQPLKAKKLYVMAALEIEKHRKKLLDSKISSGSSKATIETLEGLLQHDASTGHDRSLDTAWRGAEAYHFFMLAQRQLYEESIEASMNSAMRLKEYEDILDPRDIASVIALTSFYSRNFNQCSKAFTKLESLETITNEQREHYQNLAVSIFTAHPPKDSGRAMAQCPACAAPARDWYTSCTDCGQNFHACIVTGRTIFGNDHTWTCRVCKHRAFENEIYRFKNCPLCHSPVQYN